MKIIESYPPNFAALRKAFNIPRGRGVIYCYGTIIYNPERISVRPHLIAHEQVHSDRQEAGGPVGWWARYIDDPTFRLAEEIPAHVAEYRWFLDRGNIYELDNIADRLSSPLYGSLVTHEQARKIITEAACPESSAARAT